MTRRDCRLSVPSGAALGMVLLASGLTAQAPPPSPIEVVYSISSSDDRILRLDFATGTSTVVNSDASGRKRFEGLAVRNDGSTVHLLVCDSGDGDGAVLFYENATGAGHSIATEIPSPNRVSLDLAGNAYVVGSSDDGSQAQVWMLPQGGSRPGGYGTPVLIDRDLRSQRLEDTKVVPFSGGHLQQGDLLVLSRRPAAIFRYPRCASRDPACTHFGPRQVFIPRSAFPRLSRPTGLAFAPNRDLLVSTLAGPILRYNADGNRVRPDFARDRGRGRLKIAVGVQDDKSYAFVANHDAHSIQRFLINDDGTGTADGAVSDKVRNPNGVGLASAQGAPTPAGGCLTGPPACEGVTVIPATQIELTFDHVLRAGITTARIIEFEDNREARRDTFEVDQSLKEFFPEGSPLRDELPDVIVPAHVQAFRKGDPAEGVPTFLMAIMDTTATFRRTVEFHYEEEGQLGYQPPCTDPLSTSNETRTFKVADPRSEPLTVEGPVFRDISSGCGSNIGRDDDFSFYLVARSTRTPAEIVDTQFDNAFAALDPEVYPCIDPDLRGQLVAKLREARAAQRDEAIARLKEFIALVDANPKGFAACETNVVGELIARALAMVYNLPKTLPSLNSP
jgi:hypothetical protein